MVDTQSLSHKYQNWRVSETLKQAERTLQSADRTLQRIAESEKRSEVLDLELRKSHDEFNEILRKLGMPPLDPLPPKKTRPPG